MDTYLFGLNNEMPDFCDADVILLIILAGVMVCDTFSAFKDIYVSLLGDVYKESFLPS